MSRYDGSIRINTDIKTKEANVQLAALENRIQKTADKISSLRSKMDALKDVKIPTQEYKDIAAQIEKAEQKFNRLLEKQEQMQREGKDNGAAWQRLDDQIEEVGNEIRYAKGELQDLVDTGKAFTLGQDTEEYTKLGQQLQYAENEISILGQKHDILELKQKKAADGYKKLASTAKSAFDSIGRILKKANTAINAFGRRIKEVAQKHLPFFRKETERTKSSLSGFRARLRSLAVSLLIFNQISRMFRATASGIKEGFENLYEENERFKNSVNSLKASMLTLKNALAGAFAPIVEIAIPYLQKLIDYLTTAVNLLGQFIAALTGKKTYTRAIKQTAEALKDAAEATEDETEALDKQLSPLDKLNNLSSQKDKDKDKDKGSGSGSGSGIMFEEVPIDSSVLDMADKVKDILSKLFAPLKKAWDREGKFVMDSWKYALDEVWKLIKDIGRDFLEVWQQEKTVKIFEDLLHIIGDIGLVVGHLARNFRDAWNENKTGLHILENIRDIIGVIVHNIRLAADKTVEWADKLNFKPLLEAFERFTESLVPVMDNLSGILTDFYTQVLLPLAKWTVEKGLPELLDVFTAFNKKVDWKALRDRLSEFWEHLEPFAETVGEGLILFIRDVSDAIADFINSPEFDGFLTRIEQWMDNVSPEEVADAMEMIVKALIGLKIALLGFSAISAIAGVFSTIKSFLEFFASFGGVVAKGAKLVASGVSGIVASIGGILPALAIVAAAAAGWEIGTWINEKLLGVDTPSFTEMMEGIKSSFTDGSWKEALHLWGEDIKAAWTEIWGYVKEDWENCYIGEMIGSFTDGSWQEALSLWGDDIYNAFVTLGERQEEVWDSIMSTLKQKFEGIKDIVIDVFNWISDKVKSIAKEISNIGTSAKNAGSSLARSPLLSSKSRTMETYAVHPAVASLQNAEIPAYANGQVIPRTMKEHLAILGDNNREPEIVSPLSTMKQATKEAFAEEGLTRGNNSGGGSSIYEFSVDGQVFFRIMEKYAAEYKKQHGGRPAFS